MTPAIQLVAYCVLVVAASLAGGFVPTRTKIPHTAMQVVVSFVAGLMLGVSLFHMIPHAAAHTHSLDQTVLWTVIGLLVMFFLLRAFDFHHHEPLEGDAHAHDHGHAPTAHRLSWVGVAVGLGLHTAIDGVALGASVVAEARHDPHAPVFGLGTFLAVVLHKPLDALAITALMLAGGWAKRSMLLANAGFAAMCPLGAALFYFGVAGGGDEVVGIALAFAAGVFLCISLGDLLPELQFHSHDRIKLSFALLLGVALAYAIGFLESAHAHGHVHG